MTDATARFYRAIVPFDDFSQITDPRVYHALPDGWWIGLTDVTGSTQAIAKGRYKQVNMAGAAAISAVMNALDSREFPFVFGGDGTSFAVAGEQLLDAVEDSSHGHPYGQRCLVSAKVNVIRQFGK